MYAIKITENNTSRLFKTPFNENRIPEIAIYDTIEQANADIEVIQRVAKEDSLELSVEVIDYAEELEKMNMMMWHYLISCSKEVKKWKI